MDVHVDAVPRREPAMEPFEVMTSESQERMLAIVTPTDRAAVEEVCRRWEVRATVIGTVTAPLPVGRWAPAHPRRRRDGAGRRPRRLAVRRRPALRPPPRRPRRPRRAPAPTIPAATLVPGLTPERVGADVLALLADASWVYRQYDHQLFLNTVVGPGEDAAVLRLAAPGLPPSRRGLAISTDSNPRWCALDPRLGTAMTVAESALNVACAGARPVALVNCLNFGNPEHPEVMWQLSESVDGMAEACRALDIPVIGGNVSLYNASGGNDIDPTPVVAVLGVIDALERRPPGTGFEAGSTLVVLGETDPSAGRQPVGGGVPRPTAGGRCPRSTSPPTPDWWVSSWSWYPRRGCSPRCTTSRAGAWRWRWPRARCAPGWAASSTASRGTPSCSRSPRRASCWGRRAPTRCWPGPGPPVCRARVIGVAGGDAVVVTGLVEVSVEEAVEAWRTALPGALGEAVTD